MCTQLYPKIYVVLAELKPAANSKFKEYWAKPHFLQILLN